MMNTLLFDAFRGKVFCSVHRHRSLETNPIKDNVTRALGGQSHGRQSAFGQRYSRWRRIRAQRPSVAPKEKPWGGGGDSPMICYLLIELQRLS